MELVAKYENKRLKESLGGAITPKMAGVYRTHRGEGVGSLLESPEGTFPANACTPGTLAVDFRVLYP